MKEQGETNMGKIFVLIGASSAGKDTVMKKLLIETPHLAPLISYTTRPPREGEVDGVQYHFVDKKYIEEKELSREVIEKRTYNTIAGEWIYATLDSEDINLTGKSYVTIKDPRGAQKLKQYYGEENVVIILIAVDDGIRLMRALTREMTQPTPHYKEMCRRFLADCEDFRDVKYDFVCENVDVIKCVQEVKRIIKENRKITFINK